MKVVERLIPHDKFRSAKYNLQKQKLHVSPYMIPLHQEMLAQVPPKDACAKPEQNTSTKVMIVMTYMHSKQTRTTSAISISHSNKENPGCKRTS